MVDKIDGPGPTHTRKTDAHRPQGPSPSADRNEPVQESSPVARAHPDSEVVESTLLKKAESEIAAASEVDREQVQRIKEAIQRGDFAVDPARVAKAFVELEAMLVERG